jgi:hypothetical protein
MVVIRCALEKKICRPPVLGSAPLVALACDWKSMPLSQYEVEETSFQCIGTANIIVCRIPDFHNRNPPLVQRK